MRSGDRLLLKVARVLLTGLSGSLATTDPKAVGMLKDIPSLFCFRDDQRMREWLSFLQRIRGGLADFGVLRSRD